MQGAEAQWHNTCFAYRNSQVQSLDIGVEGWEGFYLKCWTLLVSIAKEMMLMD